MKRIIIFLPTIVLFAVFVFFYKGFAHNLEVTHQAQKQEQQRLADEEAARKAELQRQADIEAERQKAELIAKIEAHKRQKQAEIDERNRKIIQETEQANAQSKKLQAQIIKLQKDILNVRAARDKAQSEASETRLDLEKARIEKRNAEFEIQRYTDMLATRMGQSQALFAEQIADAKKKR